MFSFSILGSALLAASLARANPYAHSSVTESVLPFQILDGYTSPETVSVKGGLDLPKLTPGVNASTYDWWYFDAVSATENAAVTIVFYNFANNTLSVPYLGGPLLVQVVVTFENGTTSIKATGVNKGADFQNSDRGIASQWKGDDSLHTFTGSSLDVSNPIYTISLDNPAEGIVGSLRFNSVSSPHYPCDLNKPGVTEELFPNVWWANAVPDSNAVADLVVDGEPFHLQGYGYHDKNWGAGSLESVTKTWYWGHGRVGPYSIVWFDAVEKAGTEHFSSWVTKDGEVLAQSCADQSTIVRPWGENCQYPPTPGMAAPSGYNIRFEMGDGKAFVANFTAAATQVATDTYKRLLGPIVGGIEGEEQYEGMSLCEQFQF